MIESTGDDVAFVVSATLSVLTMQAGFAMLEAGSVSRKNKVGVDAP